MSGSKTYEARETAERRQREDRLRREEDERRRRLVEELGSRIRAARSECREMRDAWSAAQDIAAGLDQYLRMLERRLGNLAAAESVYGEAGSEIERRLSLIRAVRDAEEAALLVECEEASQSAQTYASTPTASRVYAERVLSIVSELRPARGVASARGRLNDEARGRLRSCMESLALQAEAEDQMLAQREAQEKLRRDREKRDRLASDLDGMTQKVNLHSGILARWSPDGMRQMDAFLTDRRARIGDGVEEEDLDRLVEEARGMEQMLHELIQRGEEKNARVAARERLTCEVAEALEELGLRTRSITFLEEDGEEIVVLDVVHPKTGLWMRWEFPPDALVRCHASHDDAQTCKADVEMLREALSRRGIEMSLKSVQPLDGARARSLEAATMRTATSHELET